MTNPHRKVGVFCLVVNGIGTDEFRWILSGKGAYDTYYGGGNPDKIQNS